MRRHRPAHGDWDRVTREFMRFHNEFSLENTPVAMVRFPEPDNPTKDRQLSINYDSLELYLDTTNESLRHISSIQAFVPSKRSTQACFRVSYAFTPSGLVQISTSKKYASGGQAGAGKYIVSHVQALNATLEKQTLDIVRFVEDVRDVVRPLSASPHHTLSHPSFLSASPTFTPSLSKTPRTARGL